MDNALTQTQLDTLLEFIGYGRLDADIWFIIHEETGGSADSLRARLHFAQVEDLAGIRPLEAVRDRADWLGMCEIMLRLEDTSPTAEALLDYLAEKLGRPFGATLVCPLIPVPIPDGSDWPYASLLPGFASRQGMLRAILPGRLDLFNQLISENRPKIVIAIGDEHRTEYRKIFHHLKFNENGPFLVGWDAETVIVLADHFSAPTVREKLDQMVTFLRENALSIDTRIRLEAPILSKAEQERLNKAAARAAAAARRKPSTQHDPSDPYCVCDYCLKYEGRE